MKGADDIIGQWPSMADLGRDLGLPYSTVAAWKQRGSIPVSYWRQIIHAAQRRGYRAVTADLLIAVHDQAAANLASDGFAEETPAAGERQVTDEPAEHTGQFSRWKPLRRSHFASPEEIAEHVRALRSEWDRR
jgi:hypothetical protein